MDMSEHYCLYPAVQIVRTRQTIIPTLQRKDEWEQDDLDVIKEIQKFAHFNCSRFNEKMNGCLIVGYVHNVIKEIHPHLKMKICSKTLPTGCFWTKMTKAEFMTSAGIYIDCGDELKQYPDDELLILILSKYD